MPLGLWQALFFLAPLAFLVLMSFWTVKNFRLEPDLTAANWLNMWRKGYVVEDIRQYLRKLAAEARK